MTRLIRRAVLAMVAASAGIVLHGQTTTADNALLDLGGLTGRPDRPSERTAAPRRHPRPAPDHHVAGAPVAAAAVRCSRCQRSRDSRRSRCSRATGRHQYHRRPIPASANPSHRSSIPASANPIPPIIDPGIGRPIHRSSIRESANPSRRPRSRGGQPIPPVIDPGVGQPIPPIADPPSPGSGCRHPTAAGDDAGSPPGDGPAPSSGEATPVDALPPPGPADGVTAPATGSNRPTGATSAAGGATGTGIPGVAAGGGDGWMRPPTRLTARDRCTRPWISSPTTPSRPVVRVDAEARRRWRPGYRAAVGAKGFPSPRWAPCSRRSARCGS